MTLYKLQVFDDGECAVRKTTQRSSFQTNVLFNLLSELNAYLESSVCVRSLRQDDLH